MKDLYINRYYPTLFLALLALLITEFTVGFPNIAHATEIPERSQVEEFLQSDEAKHQIEMLIQAAQSNGSNIEASQISLGTPGKVIYLHYDDAGALANSIASDQSFDWVAPVEVNGQLAGQVIVWNNEGRLEVGNYDSDKGVSQMLNENNDTILVCDEFSHAYYSLADDVVTPLNEAARQIMPAPLPVQQADETIRAAAPSASQDLTGSGPGSITTSEQKNTDKSINICLLIGVAAVTLVGLTVVLASLMRAKKVQQQNHRR